MTWYLLLNDGTYYLFSPASNFYFTASDVNGTPVDISIIFPTWGPSFTGTILPITLAQVEEIVGTIPPAL
jgi:hypothetical protein